MERLGKTNIPKKLAEIDEERHQNPEIFNSALQLQWYQNQLDKQMTPTNAGGMLNGQTPREQMRIAMTGANGGENA